MSTTTTDKQTVRDYRIERFRDLRFSEKEAEELADMRNASGQLVDWHLVRNAINAGCNHKRALWIFSKEEDKKQ